MPDMTLCSSLHCPVKGDCFRATAKPNPVKQSYYNFEYTCHEDNGFADFIKKWKERLISYGIEKGDKMKFNFIDYIEFEIDWKAVAAIAACVLGYAIITVI